jgi:hypothetical protein
LSVNRKVCDGDRLNPMTGIISIRRPCGHLTQSYDGCSFG